MKAVILAGGAGSRLWPLSRKKKPKQFQKFLSEKTMLQETLDRLSFLKPTDIFIATNQEYQQIVLEQVGNKVPKENILVEPALRDTAPCIGMAAVYIAQKYPKEVMSVIYADHLIQNTREFRQKLKVAEKLAKQEGTINIIEVKAKYPNVNLGYVKMGKLLQEIDKAEVYAFEGFHEKPNLETAMKFVMSFKYLWNTGLFVWRVDTLLQQYQKFLPKTYAHLMHIQKSIGTPKEAAAIKKHYNACEKISIDYGIMEKLEHKIVRIIPAQLGWSDVGTWESILEELPHTEKGNLVRGHHVEIDTKDSLIYGGERKVIATIGIDNLIIVDTGDVLLVCKKSRSQDVKKLVEKIKKTPFKKLL